jgi:hypothetical protein
MNRRQSDFIKLLTYSKDILNLRVRVADKLDEEGAVGLYTQPEDDERGEIQVKRKDQTMIGMTLTLLHELGHHQDFLHHGEDKVDDRAQTLWDNLGSKAPKWAKKRVWEFEERANSYILKIAKLLDIKIPMFLYEYDLERSRKYLQLLFKTDTISNKNWLKTKKQIRKKLTRKRYDSKAERRPRSKEKF